MSVTTENAVQAVLFDLDGVIVFTDKYHYLGWKKLAGENGWAFDEKVNDGCRGVPRMESLEVILRHNGLELPQDQKEELAAKKNRYYVELLAGISEEDVYPGAVEFLRKIRDTGVPTGLCSSSKNAHLVLESLGLTALFDTVITGADITRAKPDPEIFLMGADRLGIDPLRCLVFEDAPSGVAGALAANMHCVGVGSPELLTEAPVTITDYSTIDLQKLLSSGT